MKNFVIGFMSHFVIYKYKKYWRRRALFYNPKVGKLRRLYCKAYVYAVNRTMNADVPLLPGHDVFSRGGATRKSSWAQWRCYCWRRHDWKKLLFIPSGHYWEKFEWGSRDWRRLLYWAWRENLWRHQNRESCSNWRELPCLLRCSRQRNRCFTYAKGHH